MFGHLFKDNSYCMTALGIRMLGLDYKTWAELRKSQSLIFINKYDQILINVSVKTKPLFINYLIAKTKNWTAIQTLSGNSMFLRSPSSKKVTEIRRQNDRLYFDKHKAWLNYIIYRVYLTFKLLFWIPIWSLWVAIGSLWVPLGPFG